MNKIKRHLDEIFALVGHTIETKQEYYVFVIGKPKSGKSRIVENFLSNSEKPKDNPLSSTVVYETTVYTHSDSTPFNIIQISDFSPQNPIFKELLTKNVDRSCLIFIQDFEEPYGINELSTNCIEVVLNDILGEYNSDERRESLIKFFSTFPKIQSADDVRKKVPGNLVVPIIIVGSKADTVSENVFHSYMHHLRKVALPYGAAVANGKSPHLFPLSLMLAKREFSPDLSGKVETVEEYFVPPLSDSSEDIEKIGHDSLPAKPDVSKTNVAFVEAPSWNDFLESLASIKRDTSKVQHTSNDSGDFLSQFE